MPWYDVWDLEKEYPIDPNINLPDKSERIEVDSNAQRIHDSKVDAVELKEVGGFTKEELQRMAAFAKIPGAGRPMNKDIYGLDVAQLESEGYTVKYVENKEWSTKAAVIMKDDEVTVAFRGTQNGENIVTDANMILSTSTFMEGRVHQGFYRGFQSLWSGIREEIDTYAASRGKPSEDLKFGFTGHSMGGAIAKIAAWFVYREWEVSADNIIVATFGDPRVFDTKQAEAYNAALGATTLRVEQKGDPVPKLSTGSSGYKHVGAQLVVDRISDDTPHLLEGYANGIKALPENGFVKTDSISFFYYASKFFQYLNELVIGTITHALKDLKAEDYKGFAQNEKEAREAALKNPSPEPTTPTRRGDISR